MVVRSGGGGALMTGRTATRRAQTKEDFDLISEIVIYCPSNEK